MGELYNLLTFLVHASNTAPTDYTSRQDLVRLEETDECFWVQELDAGGTRFNCYVTSLCNVVLVFLCRNVVYGLFSLPVPGEKARLCIVETLESSREILLVYEVVMSLTAFFVKPVFFCG